MGKKMKDWCRFAVCWWHTWRGMGADIFGLGGTMEVRMDYFIMLIMRAA